MRIAERHPLTPLEEVSLTSIADDQNGHRPTGEFNTIIVSRNQDGGASDIHIESSPRGLSVIISNRRVVAIM